VSRYDIVPEIPISFLEQRERIGEPDVELGEPRVACMSLVFILETTSETRVVVACISPSFRDQCEAVGGKWSLRILPILAGPAVGKDFEKDG